MTKTIREQLSELESRTYPTGWTKYSHYDEEHEKVLEFFKEEDKETLEVTIHSGRFFTTRTVVDLDDKIDLNDIVNKNNIY